MAVAGRGGLGAASPAAASMLARGGGLTLGMARGLEAGVARAAARAPALARAAVGEDLDLAMAMLLVKGEA